MTSFNDELKCENLKKVSQTLLDVDKSRNVDGAVEGKVDRADGVNGQGCRAMDEGREKGTEEKHKPGGQLMPVNVGDGALASIRRGRTNGGRTPADGGDCGWGPLTCGAELQDLLGHQSTGEGGGWLRLNPRNKRGREEMMVRTSDGCVWNETRQEYDVTSSFLPGTFSCQDTGWVLCDDRSRWFALMTLRTDTSLAQLRNATGEGSSLVKGGVVNGKGKRPQTEWRWRCCWQIDEALYGMEPLEEGGGELLGTDGDALVEE
ncbi:hypothetical protein An18g05400 [Aspergillus niger]|uniref:Uncharacterized protein n=2 Tax=Aspergillus niger TaxID=5061 RepID=A2RB38_ASPNC|nr:hypothetical protein An18g05400 [Aspergillus niger]CAK97458.1 hypothetical protein An18g05400 [Aspergillus niger]